jgi:ribosomal protein S18 acetylase RimI-like enzyme
MIKEKKTNDKANFNSPLGVGGLTFSFCDFENPEHLKALAVLTNHYMTDPMGDAQPLNKLQQLRLVDGLANHPTALVILAISNCKAVGLATCFVNFSTFKVKSYLYIHDIVVLDEYRGKGIGKALMQKLIEISEERKYCKVTLEVREDNTTAQQLYKNLGFDECSPNMLFWTKPIGK